MVLMGEADQLVSFASPRESVQFCQIAHVEGESPTKLVHTRLLSASVRQGDQRFRPPEQKDRVAAQALNGQMAVHGRVDEVAKVRVEVDLTSVFIVLCFCLDL